MLIIKKYTTSYQKWLLTNFGIFLTTKTGDQDGYNFYLDSLFGTIATFNVAPPENFDFMNLVESDLIW